MKKRITCLLLTLIMLVSLVPVASLTASAASLSTSESALTVLKNMATFRGTCYQVGHTNQFLIGYGTVCNETGHKVNTEGQLESNHKEHTIKQTEADTALRKAIAELDKKINSFASSNGLTLSQQQHDALALFSFDSGTAWMEGNGVVKTAIVNKVGTNDLLNAMNEWTQYAAVERRKIEVNMYMNGVYSNVVPTNYAKVTYNSNGGDMAQYTSADGSNKIYEMLFDASNTVAHTPVPTRTGMVFLGWYTSPTTVTNPQTVNNWQWMPSLNYLCAGHTLYALWQKSGEDNSNTAGVAVNYTLAKSQLASKTMYNRPNLKASDIKETGKVTADKVTVLQDYIGTDGTRWAKLGDWQWVIVKAGSNGISSGGTDIDVTVTVTNSYVNSRVNATIHSATNGSYKQGAQLRIINTAQADGFLWGQVAKSADDDTPICWVALLYTNWNSVKDGGTSGSSSSTNSKAVARATITHNGYVNVRSGAGTDSPIVGALARNETVDVYEIKTVSGHKWGRTDAGWFCMTYASVTILDDKVASQIITDKGALAYTFTGTLASAVAAYADTTTNSDKVGTDAYGKVTSDGTVAANTSVTLTSMSIVDSSVWGKISWRVDTDKDGKNDTTKYGWIQLCQSTAESFLSTNGNPINMNAAKFKLTGGELSVRPNPSSSQDASYKVSSGGEIQVTKIKLVGENMWGYITNGFAGEVYENGNVVGKEIEGWILLSSKNVQRVDMPTVEKDSGPSISGKVATVINTDSVRVRNYGATYGTVTGSLSRGTTVKVWDENEDGWYKVDSNNNGTYEYESDGWVYSQYLDVYDADDGDDGDSSSGSSGTGATTKTTGVGIVANTYSGVNVRASAGIGGAFVCKLLPGTQVDILETTTVGAAKWGRTDKGWVCMDYITMLSTTTTTTSGIPAGGQSVSSYDDIQSTPAVYTGTVKQDAKVRSTTDLGQLYSNNGNKEEVDNVVRVLSQGSPVTIYELLAVTENVVQDDDAYNGKKPDGAPGGTSTTTTVTSYWARVNGGYIYNPAAYLELDALDEVTYTLTGSETLNVRPGPSMSSGEPVATLKKGDKVIVTVLTIENDKVWGKCEVGREDGTGTSKIGYVRLDYMTQGAYYVPETTTTTTGTVPTPSNVGSTGNANTGGIANNTSGYKYTGKVIRNGSTPLKVRSTPSQDASVTTTLENGASLVIYETTIADGMIWGKCDAGWVYLYYVDLTPSGGSAIDAQVVYTEGAVIYTDSSCSEVAGTYSRMALVDIYEIVGKMARTDKGWVNTDDLG